MKNWFFGLLSGLGMCEENACGSIPPAFFIFPQNCKIKKLKRIALAQAFLWHRTQYVVQKNVKMKGLECFYQKKACQLLLLGMSKVRSPAHLILNLLCGSKPRSTFKQNKKLLYSAVELLVLVSSDSPEFYKGAVVPATIKPLCQNFQWQKLWQKWKLHP